MPSAKTLWSKWVPVSGYSSGLFMKSGSIGFAAKSTSRDICLPPRRGRPAVIQRPGGRLLCTPPFLPFLLNFHCTDAHLFRPHRLSFSSRFVIYFVGLS